MSDLTKPKNDLKQLRSQLHGIADVISSLNGGNKTREISLAYTEAQRAKMWIGQILKAIGDESPYKNDGKRKEVSDIEPQAETELWAMKACDTEVETVDFIREWLEGLKDSLIQLVRVELIEFNATTDYQLLNISVDRALASIIEAKMWLGQELQRIREEAENNG